MWKHDTETLYKRDSNMIATFEEREYEQESILIECEEHGALKTDKWKSTRCR